MRAHRVIVAIALFMLPACSQTRSSGFGYAPAFPTTARIESATIRHHAFAPLLWVSDAETYLTAYQLTDNGNVAPSQILEGPNPGIFSWPVTSGPSGQIYALNAAGISRFPAAASGNVKPGAIITCATQSITGLAEGHSGILVALNSVDPPAIEILRAGVKNCSSAGIIQGSNAPIGGAGAVAVGPDGNIYTTDNTGEGIIAFRHGALGNVAPIKTIRGPRTKLDDPFAIAVDSLGSLYVANVAANSVTVYRPGANGNMAPMSIIAGPNTGLYEPIGIAVSADGRIFVANRISNSITVFAPNASGDVVPIQVIDGSATGLSLSPRTEIAIASD